MFALGVPGVSLALAGVFHRLHMDLAGIRSCCATLMGH